jgi:hypothetical protein
MLNIETLPHAIAASREGRIRFEGPAAKEGTHNHTKQPVVLSLQMMTGCMVN